jgi:hypothetical protein
MQGMLQQKDPEKETLKKGTLDPPAGASRDHPFPKIPQPAWHSAMQ